MGYTINNVPFSATSFGPEKSIFETVDFSEYTGGDPQKIKKKIKEGKLFKPYSLVIKGNNIHVYKTPAIAAGSKEMKRAISAPNGTLEEIVIEGIDFKDAKSVGFWDYEGNKL